MGVYATPKAFNTMLGGNNTLMYKGAAKIATSRKMVFNFTNIPTGTYALGAYSDLNGNDTLDKDFLGIPIEPYGFGNNARHLTHAPSFSEASVVFSGSGTLTTGIYIH